MVIKMTTKLSVLIIVWLDETVVIANSNRQNKTDQTYAALGSSGFIIPSEKCPEQIVQAQAYQTHTQYSASTTPTLL